MLAQKQKFPHKMQTYEIQGSVSRREGEKLKTWGRGRSVLSACKASVTIYRGMHEAKPMTREMHYISVWKKSEREKPYAPKMYQNILYRMKWKFIRNLMLTNDGCWATEAWPEVHSALHSSTVGKRLSANLKARYACQGGVNQVQRGAQNRTGGEKRKGPSDANNSW